MTTVFLSGSRKINRLNDEIRRRLNNIIENELSVIVGDANGADKAMQRYFAEREYKSVIVYYVGENYRNNVGGWIANKVPSDPKLSGREFYAQKDKEMAKIAGLGLVLWDGKSAGSMHNVFELLKHGKKAVVYYGPEKCFYNVSTIEDASALLKKGDPADVASIKRKFGIARSLRELELNKQETLGLL